MTWKDILKAHCGTEKLETEKKLVGNQRELMPTRTERLPERFCYSAREV